MFTLIFKPPLPANNWDGVFDATQDSDFCIQLFGGVEDCLALNVYTPKAILISQILNGQKLFYNVCIMFLQQ